MSLATVKGAVKTRLDALVTAGTLAGATITDIKKNPLSSDFGAYPHAFLMPPAIESSALDNRTNLRTYTFSIMVLYNAENLTTTSQLETSIEAILNAFDNDPTLNGTGMGGVEPVSSSPEPFQHGGKDLIMVEIVIKARDIISLSFA
ncbi:hypothetical protein E3V39_12485 [Gammaproteobacteria bacterium LSUCC0112]|nr:hypothetical protein E3V39_12485 [Gammaproteobacteria bacterium LSUCC0112]